MLRKQPHATLAILSALSLLPACAGRGGSLGSGNGGSGSSTGNGGSSNPTGNGGSGNPTGNGGSSGGGSSGTPDGGVVQPTPAALNLFQETPTCSGAVTVGSSPVRRLSRIEYDNMVHDLGVDPNGTQPATQFVTEQKIDTGKAGNFNTNAYATVSGTLINQQYLQAAEALAAATVANTNNSLTNILPSASCGTHNAACASAFISSWANRAFRGQLDADETTALNNLYATVSAQFDFPTGIQAVIEAVLTSPRFLFVLEFGQPATGNAAAVPLTPMELATRLALYLWRSIPDQTLIDAANGVNGAHLTSASDVAAQATRMLADSRAQSALADFADQWLDIENMNGVTKDTQFTTWTAMVASELHTESLTTFTQAVLGNGSYTSLLTSNSSYINGDLAKFYGLASASSATFSAPTTVNTAANPRTGILSQGAVLAAHAHTSLPSPTLRGRMMRQQILCEEVPDPPASVGGVPIPPPPSTIPAGQTTRSLYLTHVSANSECSGCHQYMDWIGFGFDNYNAAGLYVTQENGTNVDPSGKILSDGTGDLNTTFTNMTDMVTQLSQSQQVNQCFALEELRYALLRAEVDADACSAQAIYQAFSSSNFNLQKLIVAVVSSNSFMYRTPVNAGEQCQ
ncbi:MAG TPA: DUF1592 domain-containing protein [Polyangia bacterium]|nr:DUF1592 domain-containing protein [Polyangia bacterium]